jgi:hypothetical protein
MTQKKRSLITGLLYLSLVFLGPIGILIIPELFNQTDINTYTANHLGFIWLWLLIDILIITVEVFLSILLYHLLKPMHERLSFMAFLLRMIVVLIMTLNAFNLIFILVQGGANASIYVPMHALGIYAWQLVFSFHVALLGIILIKYNQTKWQYLGYALLLGALGYLLDSFIYLFNVDNALLSGVSLFLLIFVTIGEIGMTVGLIMHKIAKDA